MTLPLASTMRMVSDFCCVVVVGGIGIRHQRAVDDAALAGAGTGAAGKRLQQARGAALGCGRKRVVADFDGPGALADRDARQRRLILRIQPPLRGARCGAQPRQRGGAQAETEPWRAKRRVWQVNE